MSYCHLYSRVVIIKVYIRFRLIFMILMILNKGTLSFNIIIALIRILIKCFL
jgi:hypothetical protein